MTTAKDAAKIKKAADDKANAGPTYAEVVAMEVPLNVISTKALVTYWLKMNRNYEGASTGSGSSKMRHFFKPNASMKRRAAEAMAEGKKREPEFGKEIARQLNNDAQAMRNFGYVVGVVIVAVAAVALVGGGSTVAATTSAQAAAVPAAATPSVAVAAVPSVAPAATGILGTGFTTTGTLGAGLGGVVDAAATGYVVGGANTLVQGGNAQKGANIGAGQGALNAVPQIDLGNSMQVSNPFAGMANPLANTPNPLSGVSMPTITSGGNGVPNPFAGIANPLAGSTSPNLGVLTPAPINIGPVSPIPSQNPMAETKRDYSGVLLALAIASPLVLP